MINPREFCREPGYPIAILFAYSIDPVFFERVPLRDLEIGGSRRIIIVGDGAELAKSISRSMNHILHVGRRYLLAEATITGAFHPKLIIRLSPDKGRVWIGSGNLTSGGWGGNHELATSWTIGPGEDDGGGWLAPMLESIVAMVPSAPCREQLEEVRRSVPWLGRNLPGAAAPPPPALLAWTRQPLAVQLAERWRGRRFRELKICTGSTDTGGSFLGWAKQSFGIEKVTICLNPALASFDPARLDRLGLDIGIIPSPGTQPMHAKFYWFSGENGNAAIVGSANCSAQAWLRPPESGGNIELVVPYDNARAGDFEAILARFNAPSHAPVQVLAPRSAENDDDADGPGGFRIVSLRLRPGSGAVEVLIAPQLPAGAVVVLALKNERQVVRVPLAMEGHFLRGVAPAGISLGDYALFAFAEITDPTGTRTTPIRWVDNEAALERTAKDEHSDPGLSGFGRPGVSSSEAHRIVQAIQRVAAGIFAGHENDQNPITGGKFGDLSLSGRKKDEDRPAPPVDPAKMIQDLRDLLARNRARGAGAIYPDLRLSVGGFMHLLFSSESKDQARLDDEIQSASEPEMENDKDGRPKNGHSREPVQTPVGDGEPTIDLDARAKFEEELGKCLNQFRSPKFANACSPRQLVDAGAFILFLCVQGRNGGWVSASKLGTVASQLVETLFETRYATRLPRGLIHALERRYIDEGKEAEFRETVGNGMLWLALIAALASSGAPGLHSAVTRASALSSVYRSRELLQVSDHEHIAILVQNLHIKEAEQAILYVAPRAMEALDRLTELLTARWDELYSEQGRGRRLIEPGAVLWDTTFGWSIHDARSGQIYVPGCIDVTAASAAHHEIALAVSRLEIIMARA